MEWVLLVLVLLGAFAVYRLYPRHCPNCGRKLSWRNWQTKTCPNDGFFGKI